MIPKIIAGKLKKLAMEVCLLEQKFVKNPDLSVQKYIQERTKEIGTEVNVIGLLKLNLGEGVEKKQDNFGRRSGQDDRSINEKGIFNESNYSNPWWFHRRQGNCQNRQMGEQLLMKYGRILLKMSGEALAGSEKYGIDGKIIGHFARELAQVMRKNIQMAIVIGGGNIHRDWPVLNGEWTARPLTIWGCWPL